MTLLLKKLLNPEEIKPMSLDENFMIGQQSLHVSDWEKAVHMFELACKADPQQPIYWAHMELARARLIKDVLEQMGGRSSVAVLKVSLNELSKTKNFTQEEGFVLSLITGDMSVEDLVALSPLPRYQTFFILFKLLKEDLVSPAEGVVH